MSGQRRQGLIEHRDVVRRGVRPGVTRTQQASQSLTTGNLRTIQERQQRVETVGPFPRLGRVLLLLRMRNRDRRVEIDLQQPGQVRDGTRGPHPFPRRRPRGHHPRQMLPVDPIQHPPRRRHAGHRTTHSMLVTEDLDMRHAVRAISNRHRHIGEHPTRRMHPRTGIRIRQRGRHTGHEPTLARQLPQHPCPGMRHHPDTIGTDLDPPHTLATLHPRSAFP
jgi:hypothetical protein